MEINIWEMRAGGKEIRFIQPAPKKIQRVREAIVSSKRTSWGTEEHEKVLWGGQGGVVGQWAGRLC